MDILRDCQHLNVIIWFPKSTQKSTNHYLASVKDFNKNTKTFFQPFLVLWGWNRERVKDVSDYIKSMKSIFWVSLLTVLPDSILSKAFRKLIKVKSFRYTCQWCHQQSGCNKMAPDSSFDQLNRIKNTFNSSAATIR